LVVAAAVVVTQPFITVRVYLLVMVAQVVVAAAELVAKQMEPTLLRVLVVPVAAVVVVTTHVTRLQVMERMVAMARSSSPISPPAPAFLQLTAS
jgi:hypothetical protein